MAFIFVLVISKQKLLIFFIIFLTLSSLNAQKAASPAIASRDSPHRFILAIPLGGGLPGGNLPDNATVDNAMPDAETAGEQSLEEQRRFDVETAASLAQRIRRDGVNPDFHLAFIGNGQPLPTEAGADALPAVLEAVPGAAFYNDLAGFLDNNYDSEYTTLLFLDIPRQPEKLIIHHGSKGNIAPMGMIRPFSDVCEELRIPYDFIIRFNELYKTRLAGGKAVMEECQNLGFPAFYVSAKHHENGRPIDAGEVEDLLFLYINALNASMDFESPDYHYSIFNFLNYTLYIGETPTVMLFLFIAASFLLVFLAHTMVYRYGMILGWRIFFRNFWVVGLLFGTMIIALYISDLLALILSRLFRVEKILFSYFTLFAKLLASLFFYYVFSLFLSRIKIHRKSGFYGNAANFIVTICSLVSAFLDFTFIPVITWAFIFTLLGAYLNKPVPVMICAILTPVPVMAAFINLIASAEPALAIMSGAGHSPLIIAIAFIAMPPLLLIQRASILRKESAIGRVRLSPESRS